MRYFFHIPIIIRNVLMQELKIRYMILCYWYIFFSLFTGKIHFISINWNWISLFYLYSDFTTSADFEELWNPVSEKLEIQPKPTSVSSVLQETPTPQNTKDAEKKPSLLKTLLKNSTPSTKSITTTTASTSVKKT